VYPLKTVMSYMPPKPLKSLHPPANYITQIANRLEFLPCNRVFSPVQKPSNAP
jgi:hypothetical protein